MSLKFKELFVPSDKTAFDCINWIRRSAVINGPDGKEVFRQDDVEAPDFWSDRALAIVVSKYFHGKLGSPERETSVKDLVDRVARTIMTWGLSASYFDVIEGKIFFEELCYILINQMASFNSPVWFNVGVYDKPQSSACYILSVEDNMESILEWYRQEAMIFKYGSGAGINVSNLRSSKEYLSSGGRPSGPVSFMRAADSIGGVIKSGGKVRRAAKMVVLDIDHPDIEEFIECKIKSKKQEEALRAMGISTELGDDSLGIPYSNSNHAVMIPDDFMRCVEKDIFWELMGSHDNLIKDSIPAKHLLRKIAEAVHFCGDPGIQFEDIINAMNTALSDGLIKSSNPCSELVWLPNSSCNLASLKLTAFLENGAFNIEKFRHVIDIIITAQDILIDNSSYPTTKIDENTRFYRPLGIGFTDLGSLLMIMGIPYDSDEGRNLAGSIASLLTAEAYTQSCALADAKGSSWAVENNEENIFNVFEKHRDYSHSLKGDIAESACSLWNNLCSDEGIQIRNMQVSLMAPTGTISFMMDCDTTGIEPELALVKYKKMVGGGIMRMVNDSIGRALTSLSYKPIEIEKILATIEETGDIEGSIESRHLPVFDCAFRSETGKRILSPKAHLKMMAAIQPAISGAISKTVNLPSETTVEEIESLIVEAHKLGIKAVTFYRDGCRANQPLTTSQNEKTSRPKPVREKLPVEVSTVRHKFRLGNEEGYLHMGMYPDGRLGEIFIRISKEGSTMAGLMDVIATLTSISLQYGVPLETMVDKFSHMKFEPAGFTNNPDIPMAQSIIDFIFRFLGLRFTTQENGNGHDEVQYQADSSCASSGGTCARCGNTMSLIGRCLVCNVCGDTSGCS